MRHEDMRDSQKALSESLRQWRQVLEAKNKVLFGFANNFEYERLYGFHMQLVYTCP